MVRVLLGNLLEPGHVTVSRPVPPAQLPDERVLREVIAGLKALQVSNESANCRDG
ncbi:hypothetical protein GCM10027075_74810 [Streptomyces heilongjiangensis]